MNRGRQSARCSIRGGSLLRPTHLQCSVARAVQAPVAVGHCGSRGFRIRKLVNCVAVRSPHPRLPGIGSPSLEWTDRTHLFPVRLCAQHRKGAPATRALAWGTISGVDCLGWLEGAAALSRFLFVVGGSLAIFCGERGLLSQRLGPRTARDNGVRNKSHVSFQRAERQVPRAFGYCAHQSKAAFVRHAHTIHTQLRTTLKPLASIRPRA